MISLEMQAGRVNAHSKLTALPFSLRTKQPFSILVIPKVDVTTGVISNVDENIGLVVSCKLFADATASDFPIYFHKWTEAAILELPENSIDLTNYDVYVGSGTSIS